MKRLDLKVGLSCAIILLSACGGKTDDGDGDTGATSNVGDGDGDDTGGDSVPTSNGDKGAACQAACAIAESCDLATDDCLETCTENESVSNAGQDAISTCLEDLSCQPGNTDLLEAVLCITDELEDTALSADQKKFCDVTSQNVQQCTGGEPDNTLGSCEAQIGVVSDELLAEINGCMQQDCEELQACVALQLLQGIDLNGVTEMAASGEFTAGGLADIMALLVLSNQLGTDSGPFSGMGGAAPAP